MPNEIIDGIFVGDLNDAVNATDDFGVLCVLEQKPFVPQGPKNWYWIPFLESVQNTSSYPNGITIEIKANLEQLDMIAEIIDILKTKHGKVLIHCAQGIERSPLSVAWYLYKKKGMTWEEAYTLVAQKRTQTQRRDVWVTGATL